MLLKKKIFEQLFNHFSTVWSPNIIRTPKLMYALYVSMQNLKFHEYNPSIVQQQYCKNANWIWTTAFFVIRKQLVNSNLATKGIGPVNIALLAAIHLGLFHGKMANNIFSFFACIFHTLIDFKTQIGVFFASKMDLNDC